MMWCRLPIIVVCCYVSVVLSVAISAVSSVFAADLSTKDLVQRHEDGIESVHTVVADIDCDQIWANGAKITPPLRTAEWHWALDGNKERKGYRAFRGGDPKKVLVGDLFDDGHISKVIMWAGEPRPLVSPQQQFGMKAWIGPSRPDLPLPSPFAEIAGEYAMFRLPLNGLDKQWTLSELIAESPQVELKGTENVQRSFHLSNRHCSSRPKNEWKVFGWLI